MIKRSLIFAAGILAMSANSYADESFEVCVPEGLCALRVTDTDSGMPVYLVKEDSTSLTLIWGNKNPDASFWLVSDEDYAEVKKWVPESLTLPAVDPDTGVSLSEKKSGGKSSTPAPSSPSSGGTTSGGLITVGNITIGGGGSSCGDCHKGNMREIHKKFLPQN